MSDHIVHAALLPHCHSRFRLLAEDSGAVELELVEVGPLQSSARQETFALQFRGPAAFVLPQRIYPLEHAALGTLEIFLVPIRRDEQGVYYEAVFNRLMQSN